MEFTRHKELAVKVTKLFSFFLIGLGSPKGLAHSIELSGNVGGTQFSTKDNVLRVNPLETDSLIANHSSAPNVGLGAGYVFSLPFAQNGWLPYVKPMINLRYFLRQHLTGQVYQYQDPEFYNYNYTISLESTWLMLDLALGVFSYHGVSGYLLGGFGGAWNRIGYYDEPLPGVLGGALFLNKNTSSKLVAEVGAGLSYDVFQPLTFAVEYLYSNLGTNNSAVTGSLNGLPAILSPIPIPVRAQSIQFVATWKIV